MIEFLAEYWLAFVFGLIIAFMGYLIKLIKKDQKNRIETAFKEVYDTEMKPVLEKFTTTDESINTRLEQIENDLGPLKEGVLSLHRRKFLDDCRQFLDTETIITLDDFNRVQREHKVYKDLGGNHEGDENWALFKAKYEAQIKRGA